MMREALNKSRSIKKSDVQEIKSLGKPPQVGKDIGDIALLMIKGSIDGDKNTWQ